MRAVAGSPVTEWYSFTFTSNIPRWGLWFLDDASPEETGNQVHTRSPVLHASKARTPTLLTAGAKDRCRCVATDAASDASDLIEQKPKRRRKPRAVKKKKEPAEPLPPTN